MRRTPLRPTSGARRQPNERSEAGVKRRKKNVNLMPPGRWEEVMQRDAWTCQGPMYGYWHRCAGPLEVHHLLARGMGGTSDPSIHDLENLVALCKAAHMWVTEHPREAEELGLYRRHGTP